MTSQSHPPHRAPFGDPAAAALRLVPHPPNFTPIGAMALFSGAYLGRRVLAFAAPLAALLLSDLVLGFYPGIWIRILQRRARSCSSAGWRCSASRRPAGRRPRRSPARSCSSSSRISACGRSAACTRAPSSGLAACYVAAIPFFQNTVAGDLFYAALLFGGFALLERAVPALRCGGQARPA